MHKLKSLFFIMIGLLSCISVWAQVIPQFTSHTLNKFFFNPAVAGISQKTNVNALVRTQYLGYTSNLYEGGQNRATFISAELPVSKVKGGLGIYLMENKFSQIQTKRELNLSYSYHKRIAVSTLGLGLSVGLNQLSLDYENYVARDTDDPLISNLNASFMSPNLNAGVFLKNSTYQLGLSVKNILNNNYTVSETGSIKEERTAYLQGQYDLPLTYTIDVSPFLLLKSNFRQVSTEAGLMARFNQRYWAGINYRWQDAIGFIGGLEIIKNKLNLNYAFDYVTLGSETKSSTSHEILLSYALSPIRIGKKSIIRTPRYNF
jgi:type IX secretion system PorP/SprF family membrane protein